MTETQIANLALSYLGAATIASLDEASQEARTCKAFYDQARDVTLTRLSPAFAQGLKVLASVDMPTGYEDSWGYAYAYPSDCLKARKIIESGQSVRGMAHDYEIGGGVILTDAYQAVLLYTKRVSDTGQFDPLFVQALAARLAADIALPLTKDSEIANAMEKRAEYYGVLSYAKDAQEAPTRKIPESDWTVR